MESMKRAQSREIVQEEYMVCVRGGWEWDVME